MLRTIAERRAAGARPRLSPHRSFESGSSWSTLVRRARPAVPLCMPGPALAEAEWRGFLEGDRMRERPPAFVVLSGSLPPGVPVDFYARLATRARTLGSRVVVDTSGAALAHAAEAGVSLLKPSLREFRALTGVQAEDEAARIELGSPPSRSGAGASSSSCRSAPQARSE